MSRRIQTVARTPKSPNSVLPAILLNCRGRTQILLHYPQLLVRGCGKSDAQPRPEELDVANGPTGKANVFICFTRGVEVVGREYRGCRGDKVERLGGRRSSWLLN
jgi:hypothetical protein